MGGENGMVGARQAATGERPILFSGPMVRAILEGRKTQTRRPVMSGARNMQESGQVCVRRNPDNDPWYKQYVWSVRGHHGVWNDYTQEQMLARCPFGQPGDRLWIREKARMRAVCGGHWVDLIYDADDAMIEHQHPDAGPFRHTSWTPSIHMPRWASRITLEIADIRVERIQEIGEEDAKAEGLQSDIRTHPLEAFANLWDSLNAKRGLGWEKNPWVWVISFRRVPEKVR